MDPVRPASVSTDATLIPPSVTQPASIASIEATNAKMNSDAFEHWSNGFQDWKTNAEIDHNLGKPLAPRPERPTIYRTQTTFADIYGNIQTGRGADDGQFYAWIETLTF